MWPASNIIALIDRWLGWLRPRHALRGHCRRQCHHRRNRSGHAGRFTVWASPRGASLFIERIFDADANEVSPAPADADLTRDAVRAGAQIGANSWGNDVQGEYDIDAAQFDELVRDADASTPGDQPYILEFSAGNAGPDAETMDSPASGKNVIATGASENVAEPWRKPTGFTPTVPTRWLIFRAAAPVRMAASNLTWWLPELGLPRRPQPTRMKQPSLGQ